MEDGLTNKRWRDEPELQEPPARVDFIGSLPNEMLVTIISLLPIKSSAQTTVLSWQWCPLWHSTLGPHRRRKALQRGAQTLLRICPWYSTPLDLIEDDEFYSGEHKHLDALSHILATHPGPVRRLAIGKFRFNYKAEPKFHELILSPTLDRLEELSFHPRHPHSLPPSMLRLAPALRRAMIRSCVFPQLDAALALHLPKLKNLELMGIRISKEDLQHLLGGCTMPEYLRLQVMDGFNSPHIASMNVHTIYVHCWCRNRLSVERFHDMVIEIAPFLERLFVLDKEGPTRISIIDAPKLIVLGYSCAEFSELVTGSLSVPKMIPTRLTPSMHTVKILALHPVGPNLDEVVRFLRCYSCTEKLYIEEMLHSY